eukprot:1289282-Pleurochrysis_carterae.AAC.1
MVVMAVVMIVAVVIVKVLAVVVFVVEVVVATVTAEAVVKAQAEVKWLSPLVQPQAAMQQASAYATKATGRPEQIESQARAHSLPLCSAEYALSPTTTLPSRMPVE